MRSDAIDQLVSSYLERPARVSWEGDAMDAIRGQIDAVTIAFGGVATAWLPLDSVEFSAKRVRFTPGVPARLEVEEPHLRVAVGQAEVDRWVERFHFPFELRLADRGLVVSTRLAGIPMGELESRLSVVRGWFVLEPNRASFLGLPEWASALMRTYLPVPPLSEGSRLASLQHERGRLWLDFSGEGFVEELTPGLAERLRRRLIPAR